MNHMISKTNVNYGGKNPDVTNVIFVNGELDPLIDLYVTENLNKYSPVITIPSKIIILVFFIQ